ncbi:MAG: alpha/beta hydrolase [Actinomycetes bacterium]
MIQARAQANNRTRTALSACIMLAVTVTALPATVAIPAAADATLPPDSPLKQALTPGGTVWSPSPFTDLRVERRALRGDVKKLAWRACPTEALPTLQCSVLPVPFNYSKPRTGTFRLAVVRLPATGRKKGSLIFNPGGPGGAGTSAIAGFAHLMPASILSRFDFVSWDPRGIGETQPALQNCPTQFPARPISGPVNWVAVRTAAAAAAAANNRTCQQNNQRFINYMGTNNVVRDLDELRAAVGDRKLTFWGMSYGTRIGYIYALNYPSKIRTMVLDGNIDPKGNYAGLTQGGTAPDSALQFLASVSPPSYNSVIATRDSLDVAPIDLGGGVTYTRWTYLDFLAPLMMFQGTWPSIHKFGALVNAARIPGPAGDHWREVLKSTIPQYNSNVGGAFSVVNCLDYADRMSAAAQNAVVTKNAAKAPVFGGTVTTDFAIGCSGLRLRPDPIPTTRSAANLARIRGLKLIVSNSTNDASTPMIWANKMAASFPSATYLKYRSGQHVIWMTTPSTCVNDRISTYVLTRRHFKSHTCAFAPPPDLPTSSP